MKLVRLVTEDNGFFKSSFGNDMLLKKQSKVALLNLTFETAFELIQIDADNNKISVTSDTDDGRTTTVVRMIGQSYNRDELDDFYNDLLLTLNSCISNIKGSNSIGSQFNIRLVDGKKQIEYRYSPFLNPFFLPDQNTVFSLNNNLIDINTSANITFISKQSLVDATDSRTDNMITGNGKFCSGNGLMICRIASSTTNGSGGQDNGFGIGLTRTDLTTIIVPGEDIPRSVTDFEIRYNRPTENYQYIKNTDPFEADSGLAPFIVEGANLYEHDVIWFRSQNGRLTGGVIQDDDGTITQTVFFDEPLDTTDIFYPYLYIRGAVANIKVDMFNYTIDPWINQGFGVLEDSPPYWDLTGLDSDGNLHNARTNGVTNTLENGSIFGGTGAAEFSIPDPAYWETTVNCQITMSPVIWKLLGYDLSISAPADPTSEESKRIAIGPNSFRNCWSFWVPLNEPKIQLSDNFIIESLSLPLDTFDASKNYYGDLGNIVNNPESDKKGRRKNILMTIPVNDNATGLVEYEANNLIFIDINNSEEINVRNLYFRILTKGFREISQSGESAVMTILIDG
jgi:hypothetical protein